MHKLSKELGYAASQQDCQTLLKMMKLGQKEALKLQQQQQQQTPVTSPQKYRQRK
jgi:hypothetical protein